MTRSRLFRSLAFLGYTAAQYLAATALMGAVVLVGYAVTGASEEDYNFFAAYLTGFPGLASVMALVFGASLPALLDQALAFGATRRELFAAIQLLLAGLRRSRPLAGSLAMVAVFLAVGAMLVVLLVAEPMGWGSLPWLLGAAALALTALAEWALARILRRVTVRG